MRPWVPFRVYDIPYTCRKGLSTVYRILMAIPKDIDIKLRTCARCGELFVVKNAKALYCSDRCRVGAHKAAERAAAKKSK